MRVYSLSIKNFRGISQMTWRPHPGVNCLIGPGDSTKTTVLDAVSLVLAHRWNVTFSDADFHNCEIESPIEIEVTLVELTDEFLHHQVFGAFLRGIADDGEIFDAPSDGTEPAVTVRLTVDASLEPIWSVVHGADEEPHRLSALQRQSFLAHRIDDSGVNHLGWSRGSALARGTGGAPDLPLTLANAQRAARRAIFDNPDPVLQEAAASAGDRIQSVAAAKMNQPRPGLDPAVQLRSGSIVLHDGDLPALSLGLGSRRLASLAVQSWATAHSGILLLDEIEHGLEPHRVRHLARELKTRAAEDRVQVFCTTHSPIILENLEVTDLAVVRSRAGLTTISAVPEEVASADPGWQALARSAPSALLASYVVVAEGSTEIGFGASLIANFDSRDASPAALRGLAIMNGGGSEAPGRAERLARLGYSTALMIDHDEGTNQADVEQAVEAGCSLVQCSQGNCLEMEIVASLDADGLIELVNLAVELNGSEDPEASVRDAVTGRFPAFYEAPAGLPVATWIDNLGLDTVRTAIGDTASQARWFKREGRGFRLGELIAELVQPGDDTPLGRLLLTLQSFTHPGQVGDGER